MWIHIQGSGKGHLNSNRTKQQVRDYARITILTDVDLLRISRLRREVFGIHYLSDHSVLQGIFSGLAACCEWAEIDRPRPTIVTRTSQCWRSFLPLRSLVVWHCLSKLRASSKEQANRSSICSSNFLALTWAWRIGSC